MFWSAKSLLHNLRVRVRLPGLEAHPGGENRKQHKKSIPPLPEYLRKNHGRTSENRFGWSHQNSVFFFCLSLLADFERGFWNRMWVGFFSLECFRSESLPICSVCVPKGCPLHFFLSAPLIGFDRVKNCSEAKKRITVYPLNIRTKRHYTSHFVSKKLRILFS